MLKEIMQAFLEYAIRQEIAEAGANGETITPAEAEKRVLDFFEKEGQEYGT